MRKLNTQDVFKAFRLITKSGLKDRLQDLIEEISKNGVESVEKAGFTGILTILEALTEEKSEAMLYEFLSSPYEMTAEEVATLEIDKQAEMLGELYRENNLKSFFSVLSGLLKTKS